MTTTIQGTKAILAHPVINQTEAHHGCSDRYTVIPTIKPIEILMSRGWAPRELQINGVRDGSREGFQRHLVRLFRDGAEDSKTGTSVEIALKTAHDRSAGFLGLLGVFSFVCENGMITGTTYESTRVRHTGFAEERVYEAVDVLTEQADKVRGAVGGWQNIELSPNQARLFARKALVLRLGARVEEYEIGRSAGCDCHGVLKRHRAGDLGNSLWTILNVTQENILREGFDVYKKGSFSESKVRAIQSLDEQTRINQALWDGAERFARGLGWVDNCPAVVN